jgi:hypothetical protein
MNLTNRALHATLYFTAYAYKQPRTMSLSINGYQAALWQLSPADPKELSVELTLPPGNNILTFASPQPPLPADNPTADARLLSFAMYGVRLVPLR